MLDDSYAPFHIARAKGATKHCMTQPTRGVAAIGRARHLRHANPAAIHPAETNCKPGAYKINDLRAKKGSSSPWS
jgi:hypothetical protein